MKFHTISRIFAMILSVMLVVCSVAIAEAPNTSEEDAPRLRVDTMIGLNDPAPEADAEEDNDPANTADTAPASIVGTWECAQLKDSILSLVETSVDYLNLSEYDIPVDSFLDLLKLTSKCMTSLTFNADNTFSLSINVSLLNLKENLTIYTGHYEYRNGFLIIEGISLPNVLYVSGNTILLQASLTDDFHLNLTFTKRS